MAGSGPAALLPLFDCVDHEFQAVGLREACGAEGQVVVPGLTPVLAGEVVVVLGAAVIRGADGLLCSLRANFVALFGAPDARGRRGVNEELEAVRVVAEDVVTFAWRLRFSIRCS